MSCRRGLMGANIFSQNFIENFFCCHSFFLGDGVTVLFWCGAFFKEHHEIECATLVFTDLPTEGGTQHRALLTCVQNAFDTDSYTQPFSPRSCYCCRNFKVQIR